MQKVIIYHFHWEKYSINGDRREEWLQEIKNCNKGEDYGVYQLYGDRMTYAKDILLYIGKAQDQSFGETIKQHEHEWNNWWHIGIRPTRIHLGRLGKTDDGNQDSWGDAIDKTEKLLIHIYNLSLNGQEFGRVRPPLEYTEHFTVFNWGNYGDILPECSSLRFSIHYWRDRKYPVELLKKLKE